MITFGKSLSDICTILALNALYLQFPFLKAPLLKQITNLIVSKIINILITKTEVGMHMMTIQHQTEDQKKDFLKAVQFHAEVLSHGTTEDIKKAKENIRFNARKFISFIDR